MADKAELIRQSSTLRAEISRLKRELRSVGSSRKQFYLKYEKFWEEFNPLIEKIKDIRSMRDDHTVSVKSLKTRRQSANTAAKDAMDELKKLQSEKHAKSRDLGISKPAPRVAEEIDRLEFKIETEVIPFEQEKRLNKLIKEKKTELERAKELTGVYQKLRKSSQTLNASKSVSGDAHRELRLHASVSQKLHEDMMVQVKKADELKARIRPVEKERRDLAKKSDSLKTELKEKTTLLVTVDKQLDEARAEDGQKRKLAEERAIAEKEAELTEKIKSGKKLTTDDLRMLQKDSP